VLPDELWNIFLELQRLLYVAILSLNLLIMWTLCPAVLPYLYDVRNVHKCRAGCVCLCLFVHPSVCLSECFIQRIVKFVMKAMAVSATMFSYVIYYDM